MESILKSRTVRRSATPFEGVVWLCKVLYRQFAIGQSSDKRCAADYKPAIQQVKKLRYAKLVLLLLGFCVASAKATNFTVFMTSSFQFSPKDLTVNAGDTVTWVNQSSSFHDTTSGVNRVPSGVWKSPLLGNGGSFSFTFNVAPGTYPYYCTPHVFTFNMVGSITVLAPNGPPLVNITGPQNGASFTAGENVLIEASATDDSGVARVEFFANGNLIGTDFSAPFSTGLNNISAGNYLLAAKAFDAQGLSATSTPVNISATEVVMGPNIISQPQSQSVLPGSNVTFSVSASGTPPLNYQWQFNGADVSGATSDSFTLTNAQPNDSGNYAVLVSDINGSTLSATAILTVTALPNILPLISVTTPTNGARFRAGSTISFQADASDEDGEIAQVEFLLDTNSIAVLTNAPYEIAISNFAAGEYVLSARATDNASGSTTSVPVNFSVLTPPVIQFSPTNGARFPFGETIRLSAQVSVVAGLDVAQFQFFEIISNDLRAISPAFLPGGTPVLNGIIGDGEPPIPPLPLGFSFDWTSAELGMHTLVGVAIDELGGTNSLAPATIEVFEPSAQNPTIAITNSPKNFSRLTNSPVLIGGISSDDFRVKNVEFQINGGSFFAATGTSNWFAEIDLPAGTNAINFRSVDFAGNFSTNDTRSFTYVVKSPLSVEVRGLGIVRPNLNGKLLEIGKIYQMVARPVRGQIFGGWNGAAISNRAVLNFAMQSNLVLTANFISTSFPNRKGIYTGLIFETNNVRPESSGFVRIQVTSRGKFSGKLAMDGGNLRLHGQLDYLGKAEIPILRRPKNPIVVMLNLDLSGSNGITGEITDGNWVSQLAAKRALPRAVVLQRVKIAKSVTFDLASGPWPPGATIEPRQNRSSGAVRFRYSDATGKKISPTAFWADDNSAPFYFSIGHLQPPVLGQAHLDLEN